MNVIKIIIIFTSTLILHSCADYKTSKKLAKPERKYYSSLGFALIYEDHFYTNKIVNKKLNNQQLLLMHNFLKTNTRVKITNPYNSKTVEIKVYRTAKFPSLFNSVISRELASALELDFENPYIEINEIKKNKTFIAKQSNTYDEEKNVASKAPVEEITMDDITINKDDIKKEQKLKKDFVLVISDFYYLDSAENLKNELIKKTNLNTFSIEKINDKKYRLYAGPFKNFNALKSTYISLNNLGFENLNVFRN